MMEEEEQIEDEDEDEDEEEEEEEMIMLETEDWRMEKGERRKEDGVPMDCRVYRCSLLASSCLSYIVET